MVGHNQKSVVGCNHQMHGVVALAALAIDDTEAAGGAVDTKGTDFAAVAMHRVQATMAMIQGQERRV